MGLIKVVYSTHPLLIQLSPSGRMQSELREAAFATLRSITGISNRSQLYQLLCDLGVLRNMRVDEVGVYIIIMETIK